MKPYLNIDPGDRQADDDIFEDDVMHSRPVRHAPLHTVTTSPDRRIQPPLDRFEPRYTPIDPKGSSDTPASVKILGALVAVALIVFVAFQGWDVGTRMNLALNTIEIPHN